MEAVDRLTEQYRETLMLLADYSKCQARSAESATHDPDE